MYLPNKKWLFALIMAVIVLGVFYWQQNSSYQATKLYKDEKYGFSVEYPTNWKVEALSQKEVGMYKPNLYFSGPEHSNRNLIPSISINIWPNASIDDWISAKTIPELPNSEPETVREFTIGSRKAFEFKVFHGDGGVSRELVVVMPPELLIMKLNYPNIDEKAVFDLMMNSFQITK